MLRVLACVTQEHDPWLVALASMVCLAGAFTFLRLLRGGLTGSDASRWWARTGAIAGGGTIWATHFIAMLAHRSGMRLAFHVPLTFASMAAAVGLTWLGCHVAIVLGRNQRWARLAGGCIIGAGIGVMHYLGMQALAVPGTLVFDPAYMAASVVIGCAFSAAAVWAATWRHGGYPQIIGGLFFTLAVTGHHFMALTGTLIVLDGRPVEGWTPDGPWLAITVAVAAVSIIAVCATASIIEQNLRLRIANEARIQELSIQSIRFKAALDNMTQGLCLFDAQGRLIVHNRRFAAMLGTPVADAATAILQANQCFGDMFSSSPSAYGDNPNGNTCELADGRVIHVSRQVIPDAGWVATYEDITERRRSRDQLSHMARHDALTGLPNRVKFREHMEHVLRHTRGNGDAAVLYLDLDGFKGVNDTLGHPAGDELLRAVAVRLRDCTRETDLVARLGGDEFAIVQADVRQPTDVTALCDRLVAALRKPFDFEGDQILIGTSIGIAMADPAATADELLRNADIALYSAKAAGRGTWRFFESKMNAEMQARRMLEKDLRQALAEEQFELFYQPLIQVNTKALIGFEALLRWNHPERGMVSPAEFIPLAEETGLIRAMGAWVLERACLDAAAWPSHVKVAVNLSPVQFLKGELVHEVEQALAVSGLAASRLELEITESVLMKDSEATLTILHRLRDLGARISMDDFGTGYSSLSYLRCFPFDKIKIDQSFVRNLVTEKGNVEIIRAVVGLGQTLNMLVSAEGVETAGQLRALRIAGCNEVQGYLFSRPMPVRYVPDMLAKYSTAENDADHAEGQLAMPRLMLVGDQS